MSKRKVTDPFNVKFEPFDNYGDVIPGMSWHKITYNKEAGQGTYVLKMEPGARSKLHEHINFEEFIIKKEYNTNTNGQRTFETFRGGGGKG